MHHILKGTSKNSNFFVSSRKLRAQNRSVYGIHEDSSTELTRQSRKKCVFRGALKLVMLTITLIASNAFAGEVSRAVFTTTIEDREPVMAVDSVSSSAFSSISFFTELTDLQGHNITHQWVFEGKVMFEKSFQVSGERWRVWTSKTFLPGWSGIWTVNVLDDDRSVLTSKVFEYQ